MLQAIKDARLLVPGPATPDATTTSERPLYMVEVMPNLSRRVTLMLRGGVMVCHHVPFLRLAALQARLGADAPPALLSEILGVL